MRAFDHVAQALPRKLALLDVGARDGLQHPWDKLRASVWPILVEPDAEEAARLRDRIPPSEGLVLPLALWRETRELTLYVTASPGCSSVYRPNHAALSQFPQAERFEILREVPLRAATVDALSADGALPDVDFAKIDVQGAELDVLVGGRSYFARNLVGLEVEVEFAPMYEGQPLFADVDSWVRDALDLELWDIRKAYWKHRGGEAAGAPKGRLVFGDALFLRPVRALGPWFERLGAQGASEKAAMLVVTAIAYGYADYATAVLAATETKTVLSGALRNSLEEAVRSMDRGWRPLANGHERLFLLLEALARAFKPTRGGWASSGQSLGSRRRGPFWL